MTENIVIPSELQGMSYEFHIVSGNFITRLYLEVVQQDCSFSNWIIETKMLTELIDKVTSVLKPVIEDSLLFLVKFYLKPVLGYTSEIGYCEVNLHDIRDELC